MVTVAGAEPKRNMFSLHGGTCDLPSPRRKLDQEHPRSSGAGTAQHESCGFAPVTISRSCGWALEVPKFGSFGLFEACDVLEVQRLCYKGNLILEYTDTVYKSNAASSPYGTLGVLWHSEGLWIVWDLVF